MYINDAEVFNNQSQRRVKTKQNNNIINIIF